MSITARVKAKRAADPNRSHSKKELAYRRRLRVEVMEALGGRCACCGETEMHFLQLDHIHGGGSQHLKRVGDWASVYRSVKEQGFPRDQFRVLCCNCNFAIGHHRFCPHEVARMVDAVLVAV